MLRRIPLTSLDSNVFGADAVLGCDFVGTVVSTGADVSKLKGGDHVAGLIWGGEVKGVGGYSEYTIADENISFKVPSNTSPAEAATIPLAAATAWLALFSKTLLNIPRQSNPEPVLVWGGSSSVGQYAIQLAVWQGLKVITTCSPKNFDLVKKLGAEKAFNYSDDNVVDEIKKAAPNLTYVFDTIGSKDSSAAAGKAVSGQGKFCTVRPGKANTENVPKNVEVSDVLVWTAFLKDHSYGDFHWPASKDDHSLSTEIFDKIPSLLESGKLVPNSVILLKGLKKVPEGFEMYRKGDYSAQKLVYEL